MDWYINALKKYVDFSGRARRKEYWMFFLFYTIIYIVMVVIDAMLTAGLLTGLYILATLLPAIAVTIRRLHDIGRSGWWWLIAFVPLGGLVLLVFACLDSTPGENQFGLNPKEAAPVIV